MSLRRALLAMAVLAALVPRGMEARADSTIITTQPEQGKPYNAGPIRDNFGRAAADINSIERMNAGATAPASPSTGTLWLETPGSGTTRTLRVWIGSATAWVPIARIDSAAGAWMPPVGGGAIPSIVSAATTNLGSVPQAALQVTGSQSIASFGSSVPEGQVRFLVFTGSPTLVYNATYMILPGAANLTLSPGETAIALSLGAGKWRVGFGSLTGCGLFSSSAAGCVPASGGGTVNYLRADGTWAAPAGSGTVTSITFNNGLTASPNPITTTGTAGLATIADSRVLGNVSGITAVPVALTPTQLTTLVNAFTDTLSGAAPASGGGTTNFLRADGTWDVPPGGGSGSVTSITFTGDGTVLSSTPTAPVTTTGTLAATLNTQSANTVLAGPTTGAVMAPTFRALVSADLPSIACADLSDDGTACTASTGTSGHTLPFLDTVNFWGAPQRGDQGTVVISTSTFTPDLSAAQHFDLTLSNPACPCTIANPTNAASALGSVGMLIIRESASGGDDVTAWGSSWVLPGNQPPVLDQTADAINAFSYYVLDATHVILSPPILGSNDLTGVITSSGNTTSITSQTGIGTKFVVDTSPTIVTPTITGSFTATGLVTNADLVSPATTVNGQTCTLGSTCTVTAAAGSITVGTTTIGSGTNGRLLYDNSGTLGEMALGTGVATALGTNVGSAGAPVVNGGALGTPSSGVATSLTGTASGLTAGTVTTNANLTGVITSSGNATSIASQTGTGTKFVVDNAPTLITPILGVATATSVNKLTLTQPSSGATLTIADGKTLTDTSGVGAVLLKGATGGGFAAAAAADIPATPLATGTSVSLAGPKQYYVCTGTCTVTPPVPVAGWEFCVFNDDNVATAITLAALGSSAMYENTARTAYGTAGTGTLSATAAAANKVCIVGRDSTHYFTLSSTGTWTAS